MEWPLQPFVWELLPKRGKPASPPNFTNYLEHKVERKGGEIEKKRGRNWKEKSEKMKKKREKLKRKEGGIEKKKGIR